MQHFQDGCIPVSDIDTAAELMRCIMRGELDGQRTTVGERMRAAAYLVHWYNQGDIWSDPEDAENADALSQAVEAYYRERDKSAAGTDGDGGTGLDNLAADAAGGWGLPDSPSG